MAKISQDYEVEGCNGFQDEAQQQQKEQGRNKQS